MTYNNIQFQVLQPSEGKLLTNGQTYSKMVYLGANDSVLNWHEVDLFLNWLNEQNIELAELNEVNQLRERVSILLQLNSEMKLNENMLLECLLLISLIIYA